MTWVHRLIENVSKRFSAIYSNDSIRLGDYTIRVVDQEEIFDITIFDLKSITPPKQINGIFYDELESHLEDTLKDIQWYDKKSPMEGALFLTF